MSDYIKQAIAEACGKPLPFHTSSDPERTREVYDGEWQMLPDYLNDLNAMQVAVLTLPEELHEKYLDELYAIVCAYSMYDDGFRLHTATASQRAEAFLRTIGKWTDTKGE